VGQRNNIYDSNQKRVYPRNIPQKHDNPNHIFYLKNLAKSKGYNVTEGACQQYAPTRLVDNIQQKRSTPLARTDR
jgi:hypothetical protein